MVREGKEGNEWMSPDSLEKSFIPRICMNVGLMFQRQKRMLFTVGIENCSSISEFNVIYVWINNKTNEFQSQLSCIVSN